MRVKTYKLTLFAVSTYGGQIIQDQQPQRVEITCHSIGEKKTLREKAKRHCLRDEFCNYYITEQAANYAITWALSN